MHNIKNVLLDLGKVLYDIDIDKMLNHFNGMIEPGYTQVTFSMEEQHELFDRLDLGTISMEDFAEGLKAAYHLQGSREEIIAGWNSLLIGVIPGRVEAVTSLAKNYRVGLLSNTNAFHHQSYEEETRPLFEPMEHLFFSYQMGLRKPDPEIYREVLHRTGWEAAETLFMDDGLRNIHTAQSLGFQVMLYRDESDFEALMELLHPEMSVSSVRPPFSR